MLHGVQPAVHHQFASQRQQCQKVGDCMFDGLVPLNCDQRACVFQCLDSTQTSSAHPSNIPEVVHLFTLKSSSLVTNLLDPNVT